MRRPLYVTCLALLIALVSRPAAAQEPPRFTSSVEVMSIDVTVLDRQGRPIEGLKPEDFAAEVNDRPRKVLSAQWIPQGVSNTTPIVVPPEGYSSNAGSELGRLIVIVIDQPNLRFDSLVSLREALSAFLDTLHPSDRVAVVGIGLGGNSTPFTADRAMSKRALSRMVGQRRLIEDRQRQIALSEAMEIYRGDPIALANAVNRECVGLGGPRYEDCIVSVENASSTIALQLQGDTRRTIVAMNGLLTTLRLVDAVKTMIFVSEGFALGDEDRSLLDLGSLAAAARTAIYAIKPDHDVFTAATERLPLAEADDRRLMSQGLDLMTGTARGTLFDVSAGAVPALKRIESEMSGYYLLGLEAEPQDRRTARNEVGIKVGRRGATVRWRREVPGSSLRPPPASPMEAAITALRSPLMLSGLPLEVISFSLRDPDPGKVQLLLHASVGQEYSSPQPVALSYTISDQTGRVVESQNATAQLPPVMNGVPSPLQLRLGASLPAGDYLFRLAVADGDRIGSIEHQVHAALLPAANGIQLSELVVGGPAFNRDPLQPSVGHVVNFGVVHPYLEAYGAGSEQLVMKYEIARDAKSPAMLTADIRGQAVGNGRTIFTQMIPVRQLPSGSYVLRANVMRPEAGSTPMKTMARTFEIAPPPVLMTSAEGSSVPTSDANSTFLPVGDQLRMRTFDPADMQRPDVLEKFRARLNDATRGPFEKGIAALSARDYPSAEAAFKSAIQTDSESTAALVYLAATFAATGRDEQAAGAWQTALIDGSDIPEIYLWLADTHLRTRDLAEARSILEEAVGSWPADARFAKPLALLYATLGRGAEAVRVMARHLATNQNDRESLSLAVEWIFHLHASGIAARTPADDLKLARSYADAYEKANGPSLALVKEWVSALEENRR